MALETIGLTDQHRSEIDGRGDWRELFRFLGFTIPAILIVGGVLVSVAGYSFNFSELIKASGLLIILGVGLYILEILLFFTQHYSTDREEKDALQLMSTYTVYAAPSSEEKP